MSIDYGFRCVDCDSVLLDNYGEWATASMYLSLPQLVVFAHAYDALCETFVDFRIGSYFGDVDMSKLMAWLHLHGDHTLLIVDEYGDRQYYVIDSSTLGVVGVDSRC